MQLCLSPVAPDSASLETGQPNSVILHDQQQESKETQALQVNEGI